MCPAAMKQKDVYLMTSKRIFISREGNGILKAYDAETLDFKAIDSRQGQ